jgi:hypothetical protein
VLKKPIIRFIKIRKDEKMNLKDAFRYQKFLNKLSEDAICSITSRENCLRTTKTHKRSLVKPDAEDYVETIDNENPFTVDDLIAFMKELSIEKEYLTCQINIAKSSCDFDIDSLVESNKINQNLCKAIKTALSIIPFSYTEKAKDYKFDINGIQIPYCYDVEIDETRIFDGDKAKAIMKNAIANCEEKSKVIERMMINTEVNYSATYDVNDDFDDIVVNFINRHKNELTEVDDVDK